MSAWELPGNEAAAERLREAAQRETLAPALLLSGSGDRMAAAQFAAAAFECIGTGEQPCGVCPGCRKVREGIHPDVTIVKDDEHRNIAVDVVRAARSDAYIRPNEGNRKVYIFPDCSILTEQDQNVLLKIVEEGPPYAAFLFCAENASAVLQTLRSRCVELKLHPTAEKSCALSDSAVAICRAVSAKKRGTAAEVLIGLERGKLTREDLQTLLDEVRSVVASALMLSYGQNPEPSMAETAGSLAKNLTKMQMMRTIELLQKYRQECLYNVSVGQVLGALTAELEGTP